MVTSGNAMWHIVMAVERLVAHIVLGKKPARAIVSSQKIHNSPKSGIPLKMVSSPQKMLHLVLDYEFGGDAKKGTNGEHIYQFVLVKKLAARIALIITRCDYEISNS